jgi:hypothetical protein
MVFVDELDEDDCYCTCKTEIDDPPDSCDHYNLHYCRCCGKVYCIDCGLKWGCGSCAGATDCDE